MYISRYFDFTVSEKSHWQDIVSIKTKLDSTLTRLNADHINKSQPTPQLTDLHSTVPVELAYAKLEDLKQLVALEHELLLKTWEVDLMEYIERIVLPLVASFRGDSTLHCSLLRCVHSLLGDKESTSYLLMTE